MNNNPAFRIWLEGQIVYITLHGIAILISVPFALGDGGIDSIGGVVFISVFSILFEFFFALPAIPVFAVGLKLLQLLKIDRHTNLALSLIVYIGAMYYCARLLWYWLDGRWEVRGGDTGLFYGFTVAALASAIAALFMNQRRLQEYIRFKKTEALKEQTLITPQTDKHES